MPRRLHFLVRQYNTAVANYRDEELIAEGQLRADGGRNTKAHCPQTTAGNPLARPIARIELRRPHLVLAYIGSDDRFPICKTVQLANHLLRLDVIAGS